MLRWSQLSHALGQVSPIQGTLHNPDSLLDWRWLETQAGDQSFG